jgi:hypothetical protein
MDKNNCCIYFQSEVSNITWYSMVDFNSECWTVNHCKDKKMHLLKINVSWCLIAIYMKYSHRFYERYVLDNELTKEKKIEL